MVITCQLFRTFKYGLLFLIIAYIEHLRLEHIFFKKEKMRQDFCLSFRLELLGSQEKEKIKRVDTVSHTGYSMPRWLWAFRYGGRKKPKRL